MPLYAFGSNGSGQLGIGSTDDTIVPKLCPLSDSLLGPPKRIVAGGNHTLLLFEDGTVYYSGSPHDGRVQSDSHFVSSRNIFQEAYFSALEKKARLCAAWWDGSVFVDIHDGLWTAGSGSKGEQGKGESKASNHLHQMQNFLPDPRIQCGGIVDVDSGVDHTVAVINDGTAWGWGNGRKGQLTAPKEIAWAPRRLKYPGQSVIRAVCGREFTFLMCKDGSHLVLGTNKWNLQSDCPGLISDWKDVGATWGSIFVLKKDGKIESWGRNDHGQLAPPGLPDIEQLAVGSEHVVALTKDGKVISWGWAEHGNCGVDIDEDGDVKGRWNEIPVDDGEKVLSVGAGCATSFFWAESPRIRIKRT